MADERLVTVVEGIAEINVVEVRIAVLTEGGARVHTDPTLTDLSQLTVEVSVATRLRLTDPFAAERSRRAVAVALTAFGAVMLGFQTLSRRRKSLTVGAHRAVRRVLTRKLNTSFLVTLPKQVITTVVLLDAVILGVADPLTLTSARKQNRAGQHPQEAIAHVRVPRR
jgi:hypothetical protein